MDSVLLQLVFLGTHDFDDFVRTRMLPRNGAFVEDAVIPLGHTMRSLREMLDERLIAREWYRASLCKVPQRGVVTGQIFVEMLQGQLVELIVSHTLPTEGPSCDAELEYTAWPVKRMLVVVDGW